MRSMIDMDTVQIEITNACQLECSNCSRFCPQVKQPFMMTWDIFKAAVDSMEGYPKMVGIQGGEPLLHPEFERFCEYLGSKFPKERLGLWTGFPRGKEHYREVICKTFYHIFLNDHSRDDIFHHPPLVAIREVVKNRDEMWAYIDHCWAQEAWSASINPRGTWFCELAASFSMFMSRGLGWPIESGWWWRTPKDFKKQIEDFCPMCGFAAFVRRRKSIDKLDDISPENLKIFQPLMRQPERCVVSDLQVTSKQEKMAAYKDFGYRSAIASRYGIGLFINKYAFWTPFLQDKPKEFVYEPLFETYKRRFAL